MGEEAGGLVGFGKVEDEGGPFLPGGMKFRDIQETTRNKTSLKAFKLVSLRRKSLLSAQPSLLLLINTSTFLFARPFYWVLEKSRESYLLSARSLAPTPTPAWRFGESCP